jgi:hypothetical protein
MTRSELRALETKDIWCQLYDQFPAIRCLNGYLRRPEGRVRRTVFMKHSVLNNSEAIVLLNRS